MVSCRQYDRGRTRGEDVVRGAVTSLGTKCFPPRRSHQASGLRA
jgi:hypothetical protein